MVVHLLKKFGLENYLIMPLFTHEVWVAISHWDKVLSFCFCRIQLNLRLVFHQSLDVLVYFDILRELEALCVRAHMMVNIVFLLSLNNFMLKLIFSVWAKIFIFYLLIQIVFFVLGYPVHVLEVKILLAVIWNSVEHDGNDWIIELTAVWVVCLSQQVWNVYLLAIGDIEDKKIFDQLVNLQPCRD